MPHFWAHTSSYCGRILLCGCVRVVPNFFSFSLGSKDAEELGSIEVEPNKCCCWKHLLFIGSRSEFSFRSFIWNRRVQRCVSYWIRCGSLPTHVPLGWLVGCLVACTMNVWHGQSYPENCLRLFLRFRRERFDRHVCKRHKFYVAYSSRSEMKKVSRDLSEMSKSGP